MTRYVISVMLASILLHGAASAQRAWVVKADGSGDAPTIHAAIDSAATGDGIVVWGGYYSENGLVVDGKDINFQYQNGTPIIISSSYQSGTGITFRNVGSGSNLLGFEFREYRTGISIENGAGMYWYCNIIDCGTGIEVSGVTSSPTIMFSLVDLCGTGMRILGGSSIAVRNMTIVGADTGVENLGGSFTLTRSIINGCTTGVSCSGGTTALTCNNFYLNTVDYNGCAAGAGDFYDLTRFCYAAGGSPAPYYLHVDSPCWAENNACGLDVGAFIQSPGCTGTAVKESSWGSIKKMYR